MLKGLSHLATLEELSEPESGGKTMEGRVIDGYDETGKRADTVTASESELHDLLPCQCGNKKPAMVDDVGELWVECGKCPKKTERGWYYGVHSYDGVYAQVVALWNSEAG